MSKIGSLINGALKPINLAVTKRSNLLDLQKNASASHDIALIKALPKEARALAIEWLEESRSQLRQDLFVLSHLQFKRDGFFVEFGAASGRELSNTYLLEVNFGWRGILAEPAKCWRDALQRNRTTIIDERCVWSRSNEWLTFSEVAAPELSTLQSFKDSDLHKEVRRNSTNYNVKTVSLGDLLTEHGAPEEIDYMSIDTEGSELEILEALDFNRWRFRIITCEHNFTPARERICDLLMKNGYDRVLSHVSHFDDWYVRRL